MGRRGIANACNGACALMERSEFQWFHRPTSSDVNLCRMLPANVVHDLKVPRPISQNVNFYLNDASSPKKSWFQISIKSVKPFWCKKRLRILQLPIIPCCVSLILPPQVKTQYLLFRSHAKYFLFPWKIPEKNSRRSMLCNKAVSTISNVSHKTCYHSSGLTRHLMFNGSIYYVLYKYLQILRFYLERQNYGYHN